MTHAIAIRISFITSLTLLLCSSIVCAQDDVTAIVGDLSVPASESESMAKSTDKLSAEKSVDKSDSSEKQPSSETKQARPGERVTNPDHDILNSDTKLGGVEIKGEKLTDYGYLGPGDMRTHLWNGHSNELIENGITENKLMAMSVPEVQKWHNHFHGVDGSPEHDHVDGEHNDHETIAEQPVTNPSPIYADESGEGTIVYESSVYDDSGYSQPMYGEPENVYGGGVVVGESSVYGFETPMEPMILNQGFIESWPSDQ